MPALYLTWRRAAAAGAELSVALVIINMLGKLGETGALEHKKLLLLLAFQLPH